jgi:hypothetical protein
MKKLLLCTALLGVLPSLLHAQGCIAVRQAAGLGYDNIVFEELQPADHWLLNVTNRYFEASATFRGKEYITDTLVRNRVYTLHLSATRMLANGWSLAVSLPISAADRKNSLDHGGPRTPKHTTRSFGLGDLQVAAYKWLLDGAAPANVQAGLGLKLPTGDYRYSDYFYRNDSTKVLAPVDPAIQPGDGGTGITTELHAYYTLRKTIRLFARGYYLLNPREQNGVSNLKGRAPTALELKNGSTEMSVPDQYSLRGGVHFEYRKAVFTAGIRHEGVPAEDLLGGSRGFRRAGSITSVEPGVTYQLKSALAYAYVAVPFRRTSQQSLPDRTTTALAGNYTITQGGFADYLVFVGMAWKL